MTDWNNEVNKRCPLRGVVRIRPSVMNPAMVIETLDCGHDIPRYAVSKARKRRRCIYCGGVADWGKTVEGYLAPEFER